MTATKKNVTSGVFAVILAAITVAAWLTGRWVLTAIPIGALFGFFLQKGDLCGSSAFSEVVLARDWRKVWGLWVAIVVSMLGIALGDLLGWIQLNPKPLVWASAVVGGLIFGVGIVLAGGCVSGCLYKAATGNLNSIAALLAMPAGLALAEYGPLSGWRAGLLQVRIPAADGGPVTLSSLTGLPFWALALVVALATVAWARARRSSQRAGALTPDTEATSGAILRRPWKPWQAGIAIGLLTLPAYVSSAASGRNYPLGTTHGVLHASVLLTDAPVQHVTGALAPTVPNEPGTPTPRKKVVWWLVLLVGSLMVGSQLAGRLSGQARLLPKPPEQVLVAVAGGFLVGVGAALAVGCVIGNILSGWAMMSIGALLFGIVTILSNWATTVLYLRGVH